MNKATQEETAMTVRNEAIDKLMGGEKTGIDTGEARYKPNAIKILQSDKQQKYFKEGVEISTSDYGKMFLNIPDVTIDKSKLVDSFEGTLLRYGLGYQVLEEIDKNKMKFIGSGYGMIGAQGKPMTKDDFQDKYPNYIHKNVAKLILCIGTPDEVLEDVAIGGNPFAFLDLSGASYGASFSVFDKMSAAIQDSVEWKDVIRRQRANGGSGKPTANAFKIKITCEQQINKDNQKFYVPKIEIEANKVEDAIKLQPVFEMWKEYSMFGSFGKNDTFNDEKLVDATPVKEDSEPAGPWEE